MLSEVMEHSKAPIYYYFNTILLNATEENKEGYVPNKLSVFLEEMDRLIETEVIFEKEKNIFVGRSGYLDLSDVILAIDTRDIEVQFLNTLLNDSNKILMYLNKDKREYFIFNMVTKEVEIFSNGIKEVFIIDNVYNYVRRIQSELFKDLLLLCAIMTYRDFGVYIDQYIASNRFSLEELSEERPEFFPIYDRIEEVLTEEFEICGLTYLMYLNIGITVSIDYFLDNTDIEELVLLLKFTCQIEMSCRTRDINKEMIRYLLSNPNSKLTQDMVDIHKMSRKLDAMSIS